MRRRRADCAATSSWDGVTTTSARIFGNVSISSSRMRIHVRGGATWPEGRAGGVAQEAEAAEGEEEEAEAG